MEKLKLFWEESSAEKRRTYMFVGVAAALLILIFLLTSLDDKPKKNRAVIKDKAEFRLIPKGTDKADIAALMAQINVLKKQLTEQQDAMKGVNESMADTRSQMHDVLEVNGNPEVISKLVNEMNRLRKEVKSQKEWTESRVGKLKGSTSQGGGGRVEFVLKDEMTNNDSKLEINKLPFGAPETNIGIPFTTPNLISENPLDLIHRNDQVKGSPQIKSIIENASAKKIESELTGEGSSTKMKILGRNVKVASNSVPGENRRVDPIKGDTERDLNAQKAEEDKGTPSVYLPAGSMLHGWLLTGLDAPTGLTAKTEPHPVTIRLNMSAILPNRYKVNVKDCFVIGAGWGQAANERAYIRAEKISCVFGKDKIVEQSIDGYITGEDGRNGLRGTLISRQDKLLEKAMYAGLASGIAKATTPQQVRTIQTGSGAGGVNYQAPPIDQVIGIGAQQGIATAADNISDFYLDQAKDLFPVIEIDPLREVTIHLTKGAKLTTNKSLVEALVEKVK